jgi:hypothetical protein
MGDVNARIMWALMKHGREFDPAFVAAPTAA